ncbi:hypothetical protein CR513_61220, partial [Mucuna pruriens]
MAQGGKRKMGRGAPLVAKRHDQRISFRQFKSQDLVLRKICRIADSNKLTPNWEGPYKIVEDIGKGAY